MPKNNQPFWLSLDFAQWICDGGSWPTPETNHHEHIFKAKNFFAHAEHRILNHQNTYDRIDAILALKRAIRVRLEHLDQKFDLQGLPGSDDPGDWLGKLEATGVIRKSTLRKINRIRNAVEHDGDTPPTLKECETYVEVVWYFLKVTSGSIGFVDDAEYRALEEDPLNDQRLAFDFSYQPFNVSLHGHVSVSSVSTDKKPGWLKCSAHPVQIGGIELPQPNSLHQDETDDTVFVSGSAEDDFSKTKALRFVVENPFF